MLKFYGPLARSWWFVSDLFESHENFLTLTEVSEQELEGAGHQGGVVVHHQVQ